MIDSTKLINTQTTRQQTESNEWKMRMKWKIRTSSKYVKLLRNALLLIIVYPLITVYELTEIINARISVIRHNWRSRRLCLHLLLGFHLCDELSKIVSQFKKYWTRFPEQNIYVHVHPVNKARTEKTRHDKHERWTDPQWQNWQSRRDAHGIMKLIINSMIQAKTNSVASFVIVKVLCDKNKIINSTSLQCINYGCKLSL